MSQIGQQAQNGQQATTERTTEMFTFKTEPAQGDHGRREAGLALEAGSEHSHTRRQLRRGGALSRGAVVGAGAAALLAALAVPAGASGPPNIWQAAQVGLTYPVYQPKTVFGLPLSNFKMLSCGVGQDESVFAAYGQAYSPPSNYGKVPGFSVAEGYPYICSLPGGQKSVGTWTVGTPNGKVKVAVAVYCNPAQFKSCTTASGIKNGYVLQWVQPYKSTQFLRKQTQIFLETSQLTLPQVLHIVAGVRSL
jgi:hypothetical protein